MTIRDAVVVALVLPPFGYPQLPCPEAARVNSCRWWNTAEAEHRVLALAGFDEFQVRVATGPLFDASWAWNHAGIVNDLTASQFARQAALDALVKLIGRDAVLRGELP